MELKWPKEFGFGNNSIMLKDIYLRKSKHIQIHKMAKFN